MAIESTIDGTASVRPGLSRVIIAATIGNVLEGFDFIVYGFFAVMIAEVFSRQQPDGIAVGHLRHVWPGLCRSTIGRGHHWHLYRPRRAQGWADSIDRADADRHGLDGDNARLRHDRYRRPDYHHHSTPAAGVFDGRRVRQRSRLSGRARW